MEVPGGYRVGGSNSELGGGAVYAHGPGDQLGRRRDSSGHWAGECLGTGVNTDQPVLDQRQRYGAVHAVCHWQYRRSYSHHGRAGGERAVSVRRTGLTHWNRGDGNAQGRHGVYSLGRQSDNRSAGYRQFHFYFRDLGWNDQRMESGSGRKQRDAGGGP